MPSLDIEETVIAWLNKILPEGYSASGDKPKDPTPDTYVLVDRTGGAREAMVMDRAAILIEVYNKDSRKAAKDVALMIGDRIRELTAEADDLTHADINSIVNLPDTLSQYQRYQVYADVYGRR
jgi:hypothetical protein